MRDGLLFLKLRIKHHIRVVEVIVLRQRASFKEKNEPILKSTVPPTDNFIVDIYSNFSKWNFKFQKI